ncbi:hypothetical protein Q3G72_015703 [Acer saccharum]|nr:hypothetical protein Q3G72_015703 [Acer saccharum]
MMDLYFKVRKTIAMKVKKSETIENLKVMLRKKEGISEDLQIDVPVNRQRLMFGRQMLEDNKDLAHYSIEDGFTLRELTSRGSALYLIANFIISLTVSLLQIFIRESLKEKIENKG